MISVLPSRIVYLGAWLLIALSAMLPAELAGRQLYPYWVELPATKGIAEGENVVIKYTPRDNVDSFDHQTSFAPGGFRATYSTNIRLKAN